jgi:hypothetical protein
LQTVKFRIVYGTSTKRHTSTNVVTEIALIEHLFLTAHNIHTHTHIYIYIYIYIERERERERERGERDIYIYNKI